MRCLSRFRTPIVRTHGGLTFQARRRKSTLKLRLRTAPAVQRRTFTLLATRRYAEESRDPLWAEDEFGASTLSNKLDGEGLLDEGQASSDRTSSVPKSEGSGLEFDPENAAATLRNFAEKGWFRSIREFAIEHTDKFKLDNVVCEGGNTLLHIAAQRGHVGTVAGLVKLGMNMEAKNMLGETPLFVTAKLGYVYCLRRLLSLGADPNTSDNAGVDVRDVCHERHERTREAIDLARQGYCSIQKKDPATNNLEYIVVPINRKKPSQY